MKVGTGLGKYSAQTERTAQAAIIENFAKRITTTGKVPGTHTLGVEFKTQSKEE